jgi:hypothetical protein
MSDDLDQTITAMMSGMSTDMHEMKKNLKGFELIIEKLNEVIKLNREISHKLDLKLNDNSEEPVGKTTSRKSVKKSSSEKKLAVDDDTESVSSIKSDTIQREDRSKTKKSSKKQLVVEGDSDSDKSSTSEISTNSKSSSKKEIVKLKSKSSESKSPSDNKKYSKNKLNAFRAAWISKSNVKNNKIIEVLGEDIYKKITKELKNNGVDSESSGYADEFYKIANRDYEDKIIKIKDLYNSGDFE